MKIEEIKKSVIFKTNNDTFTFKNVTIDEMLESFTPDDLKGCTGDSDGNSVLDHNAAYSALGGLA